MHINKFTLSKQLKDGKVRRSVKVGKKERQKAKGSYVQKGADRKPKQEAIFGVRVSSPAEHFIPYGASANPDNSISSSNWYVEFSLSDGFYKARPIKDTKLIRLADFYFVDKKISRVEINYKNGSETLYPFDPFSVNPPEGLLDKVDDIAKELIEISRLVKQLNKAREERGNVGYRIADELDG